MADLKIKYADWADLAITLASLATSSTLLAGRESTAIVNTTNLYLDALLAGNIRVGTSPTGGQIEVWLYGAISGTPSYPDVLTGSDAGATITSVNVKRGGLKLAKVIEIGTTSDRDYPFGPISVAQRFGGVLPDRWGAFVTHSTGVNLHSTGGTHFLRFRGVHMQSV